MIAEYFVSWPYLYPRHSCPAFQSRVQDRHNASSVHAAESGSVIFGGPVLLLGGIVFVPLSSAKKGRPVVKYSEIPLRKPCINSKASGHY